MKRQYIIVTLFFLTLMGINYSYGNIETILQNRLQNLINAEIKYQIEQMKNSSLKELINDVPEYTISLTAVKEIKSNDNASKRGSVSSSKGAIGLPFPSSKTFYYMKPGEAGSISIKNLIEGDSRANFAKLLTDNPKAMKLTDLINWPQKLEKGQFIPQEDEEEYIKKKVESFIQNGYFDESYWPNHFGKSLIYLSASDDLGKVLETTRSYITKIETVIESIQTSNKNENKNNLIKKIQEWNDLCNRVIIVYELARLRSTVIHELCHPLTWYYSGIVQGEKNQGEKNQEEKNQGEKNQEEKYQEEKYYEGVNVLISCAYELEKGYWSNDEVYLSRYDGDQTSSYRNYYNEVKGMLGYKEPKVPTFTDLKRLDYKTRNITSSAEDTLATALGLIKLYSGTQNKDQKTAIREILKQYINVNTAENRKKYVDAILNGINIKGNFFLVYKDEGTQKIPYKDSFIIADSSSNVNGIFSCKMIKTGNDKDDKDGKIFRIAVVADKKNLEVFGTKFDTQEELSYKGPDGWKSLNIQTQHATKESSEQTTQITYGLQNTITFKRKQ